MSGSHHDLSSVASKAYRTLLGLYGFIIRDVMNKVTGKERRARVHLSFLTFVHSNYIHMYMLVHTGTFTSAEYITRCSLSENELR